MKFFDFKHVFAVYYIPKSSIRCILFTIYKWSKEFVSFSGMSMPLEAILARHLDMTTFGISLITDAAMFDTESDLASNHEEVLRLANERASYVSRILEAMLQKL